MLNDDIRVYRIHFRYKIFPKRENLVNSCRGPAGQAGRILLSPISDEKLHLRGRLTRQRHAAEKWQRCWKLIPIKKKKKSQQFPVEDFKAENI